MHAAHFQGQQTNRGELQDDSFRNPAGGAWYPGHKALLKSPSLQKIGAVTSEEVW